MYVIPVIPDFAPLSFFFLLETYHSATEVLSERHLKSKIHITVLFCAKFQNDKTTKTDIVDERDFVRPVKLGPLPPIFRSLNLVMYFGCQLDEPYGFPGDHQPDATML